MSSEAAMLKLLVLLLPTVCSCWGRARPVNTEEEGKATYALSWQSWASGVPSGAGSTVPSGFPEGKVSVFQACLLDGSPDPPLLSFSTGHCLQVDRILR